MKRRFYTSAQQELVVELFFLINEWANPLRSRMAVISKRKSSDKYFKGSLWHTLETLSELARKRRKRKKVRK